MATIADPGCQTTISRLQALSLLDPEEPPATQAAIAVAAAIVEAAATRMRELFPPGSAGSSDDGGVTIDWQRPGRNVHLIIGPHSTGAGALFWRDGTEHDLVHGDQEVLAALLAQRLRWFIHTQ